MTSPDTAHPARTQRSLRRLALVLLGVWAAASFGVAYWARELSFLWGDWPFSFWMTAQGSVLVFLAITVIYAAVANRLDGPSNRHDHDLEQDSDRRPAAPPQP